jgi:hypothetical protein
MVQGLFPRHEQACVLDVLERSVVFLTPVTIDQELDQSQWLGTAWNLANLFLAGVQADMLADDAPNLVGLSEETTCYLSPAYFRRLGALRRLPGSRGGPYFSQLQAPHHWVARDAAARVAAGDRLRQTRDLRLRLRDIQPHSPAGATDREHDRRCLRNTPRGQCRQTTGWMSPSTSTSWARPWARAMDGNTSCRAAPRPDIDGA